MELRVREKNILLMGIVNAIDAVNDFGSVDIYETPKPTNSDTAIAAQVQLTDTLNLANPCVAQTSLTTTAPSWSGGSATYTATAHGRAVDDRIVVTNCDVAGYNGEFTIDTVPNANSFTVVMSDPGGAPTVVGEYKAVGGGTLTFDTLTDETSALDTKVAAWGRIYADSPGTFANRVFDADVNVTGGGEIEFNTVNFVLSKVVSMSALTIAL